MKHADGWPRGPTRDLGKTITYGSQFKKVWRKKRNQKRSPKQIRIAENRGLFDAISASFPEKPAVYDFLSGETITDEQLTELADFHRTCKEALPYILAICSVYELITYVGKIREYLYDVPGSKPEIWKCTVKQMDGKFVIAWLNDDLTPNNEYEPSPLDEDAKCELAVLTRAIE